MTDVNSDDPKAQPGPQKRGRRRAISKRIRFEVFKRDKFTCQYCGAKAPDAIMHVDHLMPIAGGGGNDLLNLVTSCESCNSGKGARRLTDDAEVVKQRDRLEELADRREQMAALLQWREELHQLRDEQIDQCDAAMRRHAPTTTLSKSGRANTAKMIDKYGLDEVLTAIEIAFERYLERDEAGVVDQQSWEEAFRKVGGVCRVRREARTNPGRARAYYVRGILRNRGLYSDQSVELVEAAASWSIDLDEVERLAKTARNWVQFRDAVHDLIDEARHGQD